MWSKRPLIAVAAVLALAACRAQPSEPQFPKAHRDVAPIVGTSFSTEDARDRLGEAEEVIGLAGVRPGMSVAVRDSRSASAAFTRAMIAGSCIAQARTANSRRLSKTRSSRKQPMTPSIASASVSA